MGRDLNLQGCGYNYALKWQSLRFTVVQATLQRYQITALRALPHSPTPSLSMLLLPLLPFLLFFHLSVLQSFNPTNNFCPKPQLLL